MYLRLSVNEMARVGHELRKTAYVLVPRWLLRRVSELLDNETR
jgi:hypothetical protein